MGRSAIALGAIGPCPGGWLYSVRRYAPKAMLRSGSRRPKRSPTMGLARPRWLSLRRAAAILVMVIAASLAFVAALSDILVDWTWFSALGYVDVFWITLTAKAALFTTVLPASATALLANGWLALRFTKGPLHLPAQSASHSVPGAASLDLWGRVRGQLLGAVAGAADV